MRSYLVLIPLAALLASCGSHNTYRDFDGSYSWTNTQAYREGYQSGFDRGYQEGMDDQDMDYRGDEFRNQDGRARGVVHYEFFPTYYNNWSQPWMQPFGFGGGWNQGNQWNRRNRWNNGWNSPWGFGGGNGWNNHCGFGGGNNWNDPWGWNSPWGNGGHFGYGGFGGYGGFNQWNNPGWGGTQPGGGGSGGGTAEPTPDDGLRRQQIQPGVVPYRRPVVINNPGGGRLETTPTLEVRETREGSSIVERPVQRPGSIAEPQQSRNGGQSQPATSVPQSTRQPVPQREVRPAAAPERRPATNTTSPSRSGGSAPSMQQPQRQPSSSSPQRSSPSTRRPQ